MVEVERDNTRGIATGGLTTGIIGTALGVMNSGGLGNLLGGWNNGAMCHENMPVNRYELSMQKELTNKDMEIAYLKGRDAAKSDSLELYRYVDGKFGGVEAQICQQSVVNAQVAANLSCLQGNVATLMGLTKTIIPIDNVCPQPMPQYNSWTAPTTAG